MQLPPSNDIEFELPPENTHLAVCYRVIDLGTQDQDWQGQTKHYRKVLVAWELPDARMEDGRPFAIMQWYTLSSSEKATLRQHLESWRGKAFTDDDFGPGGFDIKKIIGVGCYLSVVHNKSDNGKTYANIKAVMKLPGGVATPQTENERLYFSLESERFDAAVFEKLSDNLKSTIKASPEYQELAAEGTQLSQPSPDGPQGDQLERSLQAAGPDVGDGPDSEIPF